MIDFNYTAPELLPLRIQEVLDAPNEPHRIGGVVYAPESRGGLKSNYERFFGTPERAAQTLADNCPGGSCSGCPGIKAETCGLGDYDALLEWLRGKAVRA